MTNHMHAVSPYSRKVGDESLRRATGKTSAEWHAILDAAGASEWDHARIARWVATSPNVSDWWAQGVTMSYEQHIGRRVPGQRSDGTFETSVSMSFPGDDNVLVLDMVREVVERDLGEARSISAEVKYPTVKWKLHGGEGVVVMVSPPSRGQVQTTITWSKMKDAGEMVQAKAAMREWLMLVPR